MRNPVEGFPPLRPEPVAVVMVSREEKLRIKDLVRIDELVREVVPELEARGGDDFWALCPFHGEDTPSFHVRPSVGFYKCFGCDESGDIFDFVQKTRGVGFLEAAEMLAQRAGVSLSAAAPQDRQRVEASRRVRNTLDQACRVFHAALMGTEGKPGRAYLLERGFVAETLARFDVGWVSPDFSRELQAAGVSSRHIEDAGFTRQFAGRIAFGIRDGASALVGFGARRMGDGEAVKYVNTRETPGFAKRRLLYGFDKAARFLGRTRRLVVMEGYTDVMMAHQCGLTDAVATMGTSFTDEHLKLIGGRVANLVFVFDGDEAGQRAAERAVTKALDGGLEGRVVSLPAGSDPCEWFAAGHGREDFDTLLAAHGQPAVDFLCERLLGNRDLGQPGAREQVARQVLDRTRAILDPVRREALVGDIARVCAVDRLQLYRVARGGTVPADPGPKTRTPPIRARERSQIVAVAGLAGESAWAAELDALEAMGALDDVRALRLRELGLGVRDREGRVDSAEWLHVVREQEPDLAPLLERELMPPPGAVPHPRREAVEWLKNQREQERVAEKRREALARPDIASDPDQLRAVQASLEAPSRSHPGKTPATSR